MIHTKSVADHFTSIAVALHGVNVTGITARPLHHKTHNKGCRMSSAYRSATSAHDIHDILVAQRQLTYRCSLQAKARSDICFRLSLLEQHVVFSQLHHIGLTAHLNMRCNIDQCCMSCCCAQSHQCVIYTRLLRTPDTCEVHEHVDIEHMLIYQEVLELSMQAAQDKTEMCTTSTAPQHLSPVGCALEVAA